VNKAKEEHQLRLANGVDQDALDAAAESGFANGAFENTAEEMVDIADEFLLGQADAGQSERELGKEGGQQKPKLTAQLQEKIDQKHTG
jgi:hypothetical protein